jgi:hypothetical protein
VLRETYEEARPRWADLAEEEEQALQHRGGARARRTAAG